MISFLLKYTKRRRRLIGTLLVLSVGVILLLVRLNDTSTATEVFNKASALKHSEITSLKDNVDTTELSSESDRLALNTLRAFRDALQSNSARDLQSLASNEFQYRVFPNKNTMLVGNAYQLAEDFRKPSKGRKIEYNIQNIANTTDSSATVFTIISTYRYKHFNPRYIENHLLKMSADHWLVDRVGLLPLYPQSSEFYDVEILVLDRSLEKTKPKIEAAANSSLMGDPDGPIEGLLRFNAGDKIHGDEREYTVLFLFREPPPVGSTLKVEHQFERPTMGKLNPYQFSYQVDKALPFYMIWNGSHASYGCSGGPQCAGGKITYRIFLQDKEGREHLLAEKSVKIVK